MARGWESKSVEQQQAEMSTADPEPRTLLSPAQKERARKRDGLLLSRKRLLQELQTSTHPRRRQMLEQAIADVDKQLSSFDGLKGATDT